MKKRIILCIVINFILTAFVLITHQTRRGIDCPIEALTGIYCAMCGATRSTWSVLDGDFVTAYHYNVFYFLLLPYFIPRYIYSWYQFIKYKRIKTNIDFWLIFLVGIGFIILRNTILPELLP